MVASAQPLIGRLTGIEESNARHRNFGPIDGGQVSSLRRRCERGQTDDQSDVPHDVLPRFTSALYDVTASYARARPRRLKEWLVARHQPTAPQRGPGLIYRKN